NRDLRSEIAAGRFRSDLYFRLAGVELHLPPLRQRRRDVPQLIRRLLAGAGARGRAQVSAGALDLLCSYGWPGNVRELENELLRARVLAGDGAIHVRHLSDRVRAGARGEAEVRPKRRDAPSRSAGPPMTLADLERRAVLDALARTDGNKAVAAAALG